MQAPEARVDCAISIDQKDISSTNHFLGEFKSFVNEQSLQKEDAIYRGELVTGKRVGRGIQSFTDGSKYTGYWANDLRSGKGLFVDSKGGLYFGEWSKDKLQGFGTYYESSGRRYTGIWKEGTKNGYGRERWPDGTIYEGEMRDGKRHGLGVMKTTAWSYRGMWRDGNIEGEGELLVMLEPNHNNAIKTRWRGMNGVGDEGIGARFVEVPDGRLLCEVFKAETGQILETNESEAINQDLSQSNEYVLE